MSLPKFKGVDLKNPTIRKTIETHRARIAGDVEALIESGEVTPDMLVSDLIKVLKGSLPEGS